ncbi:MAG: C10 family peptidase [Muribaculaceae bacterium]|nr:C10 family peptidase [Muribaculaceae bacterium]
MKKILFLLALAMAFASCSESVEQPKDILNESPRLSKYRSVEDAIEIAGKVLATEDVGSRSGVALKSVDCAHIIVGAQTRSGDADTLLYALDIEDDGGFVLVAAPKGVEPIMAIIDSGSYSDYENQDNEAYQETLNLIKNYVSTQSASGTNGLPLIPDPDLPLLPIFKVLEYYDTIKVNRVHEPLVEVAWAQRWPENIYAPNGVAGCVPVAIAQALATMEKPDYITYTFPEKDIDAETLNWKEIKKHKHSSEAYWCTECSATQSIHNTIGRIIREIGHLANCEYADDGKSSVVTGMYIEDIINKYTGIKPYDRQGVLSSLFSDIDYYGGLAIVDYRRLGNIKLGHTFIADGTKNIEYTIIRHYLDDSDSNVYNTEYIIHEKTNLIHYNWGWGGSCNGWFNLDAVQPRNATEYDFSYEFNYSSNVYDKSTILYWYYKI